MSDPASPSTEGNLARRRKRQRWIAVAVAAGLLALSTLAWWVATHNKAAPVEAGGFGGPGGPFGGGRRRPATTVGVATAERGDMPVVLEALGTVTPTATVTVRPQVSGNISQVLFREGQHVKAGEVLVVIDPRPFENARMQAQGNLRRDEADLASARLTLERYRKLLAQDSIAGQDVDIQAATVQRLEGAAMADRAALKTAELDLSYTKIVAPVSGVLGLRVVDGGNYVATGDAAGVAVITVVDPMDVEFSIPQDQIGAIQKRVAEAKANLAATVLDRTRANVLALGQFSTLDNRINIDTGTVKAKARFPNQSGSLFPYQFVNVRIQLDILKNVVIAPVSAVRKGVNGDFVYVLNQADHKVAVRNVKTGEANADRVAVLDGLQAGEQVITEGGDRLKDGATVQLPKQAPEGPSGANGKRRQRPQGMQRPS